MSREPLRKTNIEHHLFESVEDEVYALRWFLRYHWYLVALLLLGLGLLVYVISPLPPRTVTLAAGEPHSSQDDLGQHYRAFFARNGIDLRLVRTNGPVANVGMLAGGEIDAALFRGKRRSRSCSRGKWKSWPYTSGRSTASRCGPSCRLCFDCSVTSV